MADKQTFSQSFRIPYTPTDGKDGFSISLTQYSISHKVSSSATTYTISVSVLEGSTPLAASTTTGTAGTFVAAPTDLPDYIIIDSNKLNGTLSVFNLIVNAGKSPSGNITLTISITATDGTEYTLERTIPVTTITNGSDGSDATAYRLVCNPLVVAMDSEGNPKTDYVTIAVAKSTGTVVTMITDDSTLKSEGYGVLCEDNGANEWSGLSDVSLASAVKNMPDGVSFQYINVYLVPYTDYEENVTTNAIDHVTILTSYDGADGGGIDAVNLELTNDASVVLCDEDGGVVDETNGYETTTAYMYDGADDVTSSTTFSISLASGITATMSSNVCAISSITADNASVTIKGVYTDSDSNTFTRYATYTIKKLKAGADAIVYSIVPTKRVINCDENGEPTITSVTLNVKKTSGGTTTILSASEITSAGLAIQADMYDTDGNGSDIALSGNVFSLSSFDDEDLGNPSYVDFYLYKDGDTWNEDYLDRETIHAVQDGASGADGVSAINFDLSRSSIAHSYTSSTTTYTLQVQCFEGTTNLIAGSGTGTFAAVVSTAVSNCTLYKTATSSDGTQIVFTFLIPASTAPSGEMVLLLNATSSSGDTHSKEYTIPVTTKVDGTDGSDATAVSFTPTSVVFNATDSETNADGYNSNGYMGITIAMLQNGQTATGVALTYGGSDTLETTNCQVDASAFPTIYVIPTSETYSSLAGDTFTIYATTSQLTLDIVATDSDGNSETYTHTISMTCDQSETLVTLDTNNGTYIATRVTKLETTAGELTTSYSELKQTADSISAKVDNISLANPNLLSMSALALNTNLGTSVALDSATCDLTAGETYTFTINGYVDSTDNDMYVSTRLTYTDDDGESQIGAYAAINATTATTTYTTFEAPVTGTYTLMVLMLCSDTTNYTYTTGDRTSDYAHVNWAKVEEGSSFTGYVRNENDEYVAYENALATPLAINATSYITTTTATTNKFGKVMEFTNHGEVFRGKPLIDFGINADFTDSTSATIHTYYIIARETAGTSGAHLSFGAYGATTNRKLNTTTCGAETLGSGWQLYYVSFRDATFSSSSDTSGTYYDPISGSSYIGILVAYGTWQVYAAGAIVGAGVPHPAHLIEGFTHLATGIDIITGKITATADNFVFQNNSGDTTMTINADGQIEGATFKTTDSGEGYTEMNNTWLKVVDADGMKRMELGMFTAYDDNTNGDEDSAGNVPALRFYGADETFLYDLGPSMIMTVLQESLQQVEQFAPITFSTFGITDYLQSDIYNCKSLTTVVAYLLNTSSIVSHIFSNYATLNTTTCYQYKAFIFGTNYLKGTYTTDAAEAKAANNEYFSTIGTATSSASVVGNSTQAYGIIALSALYKVTTLTDYDAYSDAYNQTEAIANIGTITENTTSCYARKVGILWKSDYGATITEVELYSTKKISASDVDNDYMD